MPLGSLISCTGRCVGCLRQRQLSVRPLPALLYYGYMGFSHLVLFEYFTCCHEFCPNIGRICALLTRQCHSADPGQRIGDAAAVQCDLETLIANTCATYTADEFNLMCVARKKKKKKIWHCTFFNFTCCFSFVDNILIFYF